MAENKTYITTKSSNKKEFIINKSIYPIVKEKLSSYLAHREEGGNIYVMNMVLSKKDLANVMSQLGEDNFQEVK